MNKGKKKRKGRGLEHPRLFYAISGVNRAERNISQASSKDARQLVAVVGAERGRFEAPSRTERHDEGGGALAFRTFGYTAVNKGCLRVVGLPTVVPGALL